MSIRGLKVTRYLQHGETLTASCPLTEVTPPWVAADLWPGRLREQAHDSWLPRSRPQAPWPLSRKDTPVEPEQNRPCCGGPDCLEAKAGSQGLGGGGSNLTCLSCPGPESSLPGTRLHVLPLARDAPSLLC